MTFNEFLNKEKPAGKASSNLKEFPLLFQEYEDILEDASTFFITDDFMKDSDKDDFAEYFSELFPTYRAFAQCDVEMTEDADTDFVFDKYVEFIICADTSKSSCPILIWSGKFEELYSSFEEFFESLIDWNPLKI